uniref:Ribonuclease H-like domain-containing protein n=1 Tax=Tanacetum cinerariifolium TaxID=118510 RepID=A0A699HDE0_TANCI|nr:ribonuclease H-like domain-containing protein [Tanacetum cinerariifolium]
MSWTGLKANDSPTNSKTDKAKTAKKPPIKYAEQYTKPTKKPNGSSQNNFDDKGYWDSGCSRHMTGNISYLFDFEPFDGGYVSFGQGGCKITGKGTIKTKCIVLGRNFKLSDDDNVLLRTPRQHNMYSIDLNNIVPHKDLTCLVAKASADECMLWHRRLGKSSHWQYKFPLPVEGVPTARRMEIPLPGVCTAMMKKLPVKDRWQLH